MNNLSVEHIDPRNGVLVSGLENEFNEVIADLSYNSRKVNRFVPYRVCEYPAPTNEGDVGEFLIGGEWVFCEFMVEGGTWWQESNRIGNCQVNGGRVGGPKNLELMSSHPNTLASRAESTKKAGKKSGAESFKNKTGLFGLSEEERREANKKGAAVISSTNGRNTMSQKWQCLVTGHVSNPGGLTSYQRARGIDTTLRVRIQD